MARKKIQKPETRSGEDIAAAEIGDYCYFLDSGNKIVFAEIKKVFEEKSILCFQVMTQSDFKFVCVPSKICSFEEHALKGKKRHILCPEVYCVK